MKKKISNRTLLDSIHILPNKHITTTSRVAHLRQLALALSGLCDLCKPGVSRELRLLRDQRARRGDARRDLVGARHCVFRTARVALITERPACARESCGWG